MESSKARPGARSNEGEPAGEKWAAMMRLSATVLRVLSLAATLTATLIMATANQTNTQLSVTAKATDSSAFVYFVVANSIAFVYSAASTMAGLMTMGKKISAGKGSMQVKMVVSIMDLVMVALLFSGAGAAITFGLLGQNGDSHALWNKVCPQFGKFCSHVRAAISVSMVGTVNYFLVLLISIIDLHKII